MKRLIPLGTTAIVLVVTACGAGHVSAPQALEVSARESRGVHALVVARRRAATREAERLLHRFMPPPGATPLRHPPAVAPLPYPALDRPADAEIAGRHAFWQVHRPLAEVVSFVKARRLRGFERGATSHSTGISGPPYTALEFDGPGRRQLTVTAVRLPRRTILRVDAGAIWIFPRSPSEVVPRGVRRIDVRAPGVAVHVAEPRKVARIIRWFDALDIVQPGVVVHCGLLLLAPTVTFEFRTRSGALLARATGPALGYSSLCNPLRFRIRGHSRTPLIGASFVARVGRLLNVRFSSRG